KSAALLAAGSKLEVESKADGVIIRVPPNAPDKISSTIVLKVKGALEIEPSTLAQDSKGMVVLPASEARLHGSEMRYESGAQRDNLGYWSNPEDWADWEFNVTKPGKCEISGASAAVESASFEVQIGEQAV